MSEIENRLDAEILKISERYQNRNKQYPIRHEGYNSGDLRRLQGLVYVRTGCHMSLKKLHYVVLQGVLN